MRLPWRKTYEPFDPGPPPDPYKIEIDPRFEASFILQDWVWTISESYLHNGSYYGYHRIGSGTADSKEEAQARAELALHRMCDKRKIEKERLSYTVKDPCGGS